MKFHIRDENKKWLALCGAEIGFDFYFLDRDHALKTPDKEVCEKCLSVNQTDL